MPPSAISQAATKPGEVCAPLLLEQHKGSVSVDLPWQGSISWSWGQHASAKGVFRGVLLRGLAVLPGSRWQNSGHTGWESLHALHSPLNVKQLLQPTSKFAQEVAAAWSGDILLLSTEMLTSNSSTTSNIFSPKASLSVMGQADHSLRLQSLCESLQHARMVACLKATGAALMAQGRVALPRPQQGGTSVDTLHASCPLQTLQVSSALAKTDADSTGSSRPQDMGVPPAINILLVALEHLPSWFPQDRLSPQQLADIAVQAALHQACICAILLLQSSRPLKDSTASLQGNQQQQQQPQLQPSSLELQQTEDAVQPMDVCADSTANAVQATVVDAEPQKPDVAHRNDSSSSQPTESAGHPQQAQQSKRAGDHLQADTSLESDAKRHRLWPATPDLQLQQASTQVAPAQTFDSEIVDSILRTVERFDWLQCTQQGKVPLQHMVQLRAQPLLNQLRVLSLYASSYTAECTASSLFSQIVHTVTRILTGTSWLAQHCGPTSQPRLSPEAEGVLKKLTLNNMLSAHSVPEITAQVVPVDLQPAYILCLAGYPGPRPLQDFAADVMHCMLLDVKQAAQHSQADEKMQEEVQANFELASDFTLRAAKASLLLRTQGAQQPTADVLTVAEPHTASEMVPAAACASAMDCDSMQHHCEDVPCMTPPAASPPVANTLQKADSVSVPQHMVKLGSQFHHNMDRFLHTMQTALDQLHRRYKTLPRSCLEVLYAKPLLTQLLILSEYCLKVKPRMNPASYLISLCRFHCDSEATQQLQSRSDEAKMPLIGTPVRTLLDDARQARAVDSRAVQVLIEGAVAVLPGPLHGVAACYAIGLFIQRASGNQALTELKRAVAQMQLLLVQARLAQA